MIAASFPEGRQHTWREFRKTMSTVIAIRERVMQHCGEGREFVLYKWESADQTKNL